MVLDTGQISAKTLTTWQVIEWSHISRLDTACSHINVRNMCLYQFLDAILKVAAKRKTLNTRKFKRQRACRTILASFSLWCLPTSKGEPYHHKSQKTFILLFLYFHSIFIYSIITIVRLFFFCILFTTKSSHSNWMTMWHRAIISPCRKQFSETKATHTHIQIEID